MARDEDNRPNYANKRGIYFKRIMKKEGLENLTLTGHI